METLPSLGGLPLTFLLEDLVVLLFSFLSTKAPPLPLWLLELYPCYPHLLHFLVDDLLKALLLVTSFLLNVSGLPGPGLSTDDGPDLGFLASQKIWYHIV